MAHGDAREGEWRGKMRMEWVASSLVLYVGTRSIQLLSADPHSSTASSRLNWHPRRFKWTRPFRWKTKSGLCACAITFRTCYNAHAPQCYITRILPVLFILFPPQAPSAESSVSLANGLPARRPDGRVSIPGGGNFFSRHRVQTVVGPIKPPFQWIRRLSFPEIKRPVPWCCQKFKLDPSVAWFLNSMAIWEEPRTQRS